MPHETREGSMAELAALVWRRRRWLACGVFAICAAGSIGLVVALPDLYRASATVLVDQGEVQESFIRSTVSGELGPRLDSISQQVLSRGALQRLIESFDLYPALRREAPPEAVIE